MTPRRKPYGCVFCPITLRCSLVQASTRSARVEFDVDVADALFYAGGPPHRTWTPTAHVLGRSLVDGHLADEQRVGVDARIAHARVRDGAGNQFLNDRRGSLRGELQELECLGCISTADEVSDDPRLTRTDALKS